MQLSCARAHDLTPHQTRIGAALDPCGTVKTRQQAAGKERCTQQLKGLNHVKVRDMQLSSARAVELMHWTSIGAGLGVKPQ